MPLRARIALIFVLFATAAMILLAVFPNDGGGVTGLIVDLLFFLLGMICLYIYSREPVKSNKLIFLNFAFFFLLSVGAIAYRFIGYSVVPGDFYFRLYWTQYHQLCHFFLLSFAVVYVVFDSLFNDFKVIWKYTLTFMVVGGMLVFYAHPFFENPNYLYSTEDIEHYRAVNTAVTAIQEQGIQQPSTESIAAAADIDVWKDGQKIGKMYHDQKVRRVAELLPYLSGDNYIPLLMKPLYLDAIYMSVLCVVFIFLFFGYQYKNDPPQGAYIEKIIFLLLPYCSLEILHNYAYINSVEYAVLLDVQQIGWYLTVANLLLLTLFFGLRLRFITSVKGEFYERELVSDAEHISRWRDSFDNLVVRHFLNPKAIHGRLFAPRTPRNKA
jgi:hypothetical protein